MDLVDEDPADVNDEAGGGAELTAADQLRIDAAFARMEEAIFSEQFDDEHDGSAREEVPDWADLDEAPPGYDADRFDAGDFEGSQLGAGEFGAGEFEAGEFVGADPFVQTAELQVVGAPSDAGVGDGDGEPARAPGSIDAALAQPPVDPPVHTVFDEPFVGRAWDAEVDGDADHVPAHARTRSAQRRKTWRAVLLACLFVAVVAGALLVHFKHVGSQGPVAPSTGGAAHTTSGAAAASSADVARLQSAITDVESSASGATAQLSTLGSIPTLARVAPIVNPYMASLQLYAALASAVTVPPAAQAAAHAADAQVQQDAAFLGTINTLPAAQLGSFLQEFYAHSAQLQSSMDGLQHALSPATP
jgi:hypothetical protein